MRARHPVWRSKYSAPSTCLTELRTLATLPLFWLRSFRGLGGYESLEPIEFLFESGHEITRAVLEQHHETKGKKQKQDDPEDRSKQGHDGQVNLPHLPGQCRCTVRNFRFERRFEAAMLDPCAFRCLI
jgi:hypothetical protein